VGKWDIADIAAWFFIVGSVSMLISSPLPSIFGLQGLEGDLTFYGGIFGGLLLLVSLCLTICPITYTQLKIRHVRRRIERIERERIVPIKGEVGRKNFDKAMELVIKWFQDCEGKDRFGAAFCNYYAARVLALKHQGNLACMSAEYNKAKNYLNRSIEIFQFLGKDKRIESWARVRCACSLFGLATLSLLADKHEEGVKACQTSLEIFTEYGMEEGVKAAKAVLWFLGVGRITSNMINVINSWSEYENTKSFHRYIG